MKTYNVKIDVAVKIEEETDDNITLAIIVMFNDVLFSRDVITITRDVFNELGGTQGISDGQLDRLESRLKDPKFLPMLMEKFASDSMGQLDGNDDS